MEALKGRARGRKPPPGNVSKFAPALNQNPLDLVEAHFVAPAVVELGGAGAGMVGHRCGLLQRAAVLEIGRDARRPETVVADLGLDAGRRGSPADHRMGVGLGQGSAGDHRRHHPVRFSRPCG